MAQVHPSAVVDSEAVLADSVEVGPLAFVGPEVSLGDRVRIGAHTAIMGRTRIEADTVVHPFACLGGPPQDKEFSGEETSLEIGERNVIREHVTIHVGTSRGGGCTRIGDDNFIMNSAHIAHDCRIGSNCIIASFSGLAGHVSVEDFAVLGAYTGVHQYSRVGESVMAASNAKLSLDAPPFSMVTGDRARLVGVNSVGLKRRGFSRETQKQIKRAFHLIFHSQLLLPDAIGAVRAELPDAPEVQRLLIFLEKTERGFCR